MGGDSIDNVPTLNPTESFDLIVTNIFARVHIALADNYLHSLRRTDGCTGLLITAGFTTEQEDDVTVALTESGFKAVDCERFNEWVAIAYRIKA